MKSRWLCASALGAFLPLAASCATSKPLSEELKASLNNPPASVASPTCVEGTAPPAPVRLLTRAQYNNTVRDLLGDTTLPAQNFPSESTMLGFEANADAYQASPLLVEDLVQAAEGIATRALASGSAGLLNCTGAAPDEACGKNFVRSFGTRVFRRPLTDNEAVLFDGLFSSTAAAEGYDRATELTLEAFLQSPQFLYRIDSPLTTQTGAIKALGSYEMASRLSYFLLNSMPDQALFDAAAANELQTADQIRAQATRLLQDPRAQNMVADFHRQWLGLDRLSSIVRVTAPGVEQPGLGPSFQASLQQFTKSAYFEGSMDVNSLFSSPSFFVDATLAPLYGATATPDAPFTRVDDTTGTRAGLLTQPGFLALLAHEDQSAPILRGAFIRERIMCQIVPPPPPTVNNTPPKVTTTGTTRQRFASHASVPACAGCHQLFDDLGFGLENYDQLGRYRTDENGTPIDATGQIEGPRDPALGVAFNGAVDLSSKLAHSSQISDCLTTQWYRYVTGRLEADADACSLHAAQAAVTAANGNLQQLLLALVTTDAFRFRAALPEEPQ